VGSADDQQKVFEGGAAGEEENEESNELDDDELNELLARGEDELDIFTAMDKEREEERLKQWRDAGNKAPLPPPLMQESELPPFYRRDIGEELAVQAAAEEESGRGRRAKAEVRYTDGLTDDQWLMAMEDSDDDVDEAADRKRKRADRKAERKRMNEMLAQAEAEGKPLNTVKIKQLQEEEGVVSTPKSGKKRGRPSKSATPSVQGDDMPTVSLH
jgi:ATP-dependent helicase STH1/SNF2